MATSGTYSNGARSTSKRDAEADPTPTLDTGTSPSAAAADAATSYSSEEPSPQSQPSSRPYEEERRILLKSVAESLSRVVNKMGVINARLADTADSCLEVEEVASVWREALSGDGDGDGDGDEAGERHHDASAATEEYQGQSKE